MPEYAQLEKPNWDQLVKVIQHSFSVNKHLDFFQWMQEGVREFLPHDVLVATWGDFTTGCLRYDVASNVPEIRTQQIIEGCDDIDPLMSDLYHRWLSNGEKWYVLNDFDVVGKNVRSANALMHRLEQMKSVLVYGIRDMRGGNDCIYAFFDHENRHLHYSVLGMLMPHIDAALRRVECLGPVVPDEEDAEDLFSDMSDREHEIMHWVGIGKTNLEIGAILNISPNTVKNHLRRIFQKMDVTSRAQAAAKYSISKLPS